MKSFWLVFAALELGFQATCAKKSTFLHFLDSFIGEIPFLVTYSVVFLCNEWAISPHTEFDIIYQKTLVCDVILALEGASHGHAEGQQEVSRLEVAAREIRQELHGAHLSGWETRKNVYI